MVYSRSYCQGKGICWIGLQAHAGWTMQIISSCSIAGCCHIFFHYVLIRLNTKQSNLAISRSSNRIYGKPVCGCCIKVAERILSLEKPEEDTNWSWCHVFRISIQEQLSEGEVEDFGTVIIFCIEPESSSSFSLNKIRKAIRANNSVKHVQIGDHVGYVCSSIASLLDMASPNMGLIFSDLEQAQVEAQPTGFFMVRRINVYEVKNLSSNRFYLSRRRQTTSQ
jgi:hypothetical protein